MWIVELEYILMAYNLWWGNCVEKKMQKDFFQFSPIFDRNFQACSLTAPTALHASHINVWISEWQAGSCQSLRNSCTLWALTHNHIKMHIFIVQLLRNSPYATWENYQSVCYFKHSLFINLVAWYNKIWLSAPLHVWSNKAYYPL